MCVYYSDFAGYSCVVIGPLFSTLSTAIDDHNITCYSLSMARAKTQYYILDNLDKESGELMRKSLASVPDITGITVDLRQGMIAIESRADMEPQVKLACDVAGTTFRTRVKKGQLY